MAVAAITACSFVVRLWFSARSGQIGDLHLWQWPGCAGMFVFGVVTARHRWDRHIPERSTAGAGGDVGDADPVAAARARRGCA